MHDGLPDAEQDKLDSATDSLQQSMQTAEQLKAEQPTAEEQLDSATDSLLGSIQSAEELKAEQQLPAKDMESAAETLQQNFQAAEELKEQQETAAEIGRNLDQQGVELKEDFEMPDGYGASVIEAEDDFEMPDGFGEIEVGDVEPVEEEPVAPDVDPTL